MTPRVSPVRLLAVAVYVLMWPALMLVLGGDAAWIEGWLFAIWLFGSWATAAVWMYVYNPELFAERLQPGKQGGGRRERSDRSLVMLIFLGFIVWIVLVPFDARRYGWTAPFPLAVKLAGGVLLIASSFLVFRTFHDNTFASSVVRIQSDRKQRVVSTGVYGFVRHPMYLGMLLMFVGGPLLLGSRLGLLVAAAEVVVLALRITREEQLLASELEGYDDYRRRVRYRLLPGVW